MNLIKLNRLYTCSGDEGKAVSNNTIVRIDPENDKFSLLITNLKRFLNEEEIGHLNAGNVHLYRYEVSYRESPTSTLFLIIPTDHISTKALPLIKEFFKVVSTHTAIISLISGMHSSQESFKKEVGIVAHSLRTPLQSIYLSLDKLRKEFERKGNNINKLVKDAKDRLLNANEDMTYLLEKAKKIQERFSIVNQVEECYKALLSYAELRRCSLYLKKPENQDYQVYGDRIFISITITNVIENAVKYSWGGLKKSYDVQISLKTFDKYLVSDSPATRSRLLHKYPEKRPGFT